MKQATIGTCPAGTLKYQLFLTLYLAELPLIAAASWVFGGGIKSFVRFPFQPRGPSRPAEVEDLREVLPIAYSVPQPIPSPGHFYSRGGIPWGVMATGYVSHTLFCPLHTGVYISSRTDICPSPFPAGTLCLLKYLDLLLFQLSFFCT